MKVYKLIAAMFFTLGMVVLLIVIPEMIVSMNHPEDEWIFVAINFCVVVYAFIRAAMIYKDAIDKEQS